MQWSWNVVSSFVCVYFNANVANENAAAWAAMIIYASDCPPATISVNTSTTMQT